MKPLKYEEDLTKKGGEKLRKNFTKRLAKHLKKARKDKRITQEEFTLAKIAEITDTSIPQILGDKKTSDKNEIIKRLDKIERKISLLISKLDKE